jgi:uncharacterized protein (DUF1786 family)
MRILAVDVGTGTQDILLFDPSREIENCAQLVLPSPTMIIAARIRRATAAGQPVLLRGVVMGGGPCHWAAMDHLRAGLPLFATPEAAQTFDDDLDNVARMGVRLVAEDEAQRLRDVVACDLKDFYYEEIVRALASFGVEEPPDACAVAVFDHGAAPPGFSDRIFRFQYLADRVGAGLAAFAFRREAIPPAMTRLRAVAATAPADRELLVMDTGPAAVLGALEDPVVRRAGRALVANVGNFHVLAFHLRHGAIVGLFEHHTGEVTASQLDGFLQRLAAGTLTNDEVYHSQGHGALVLDARVDGDEPPLLAVTGPRRALLSEARWRPYWAVPHGDMMLTGCFGLLRAYAAHDERVREAVERRLGRAA